MGSEMCIRDSIKPDHLVALIDWHVEKYSVEPDHVLGYNNHFFSEFEQIYLHKPIRHSHFTPIASDGKKP